MNDLDPVFARTKNIRLEEGRLFNIDVGPSIGFLVQDRVISVYHDRIQMVNVDNSLFLSVRIISSEVSSGRATPD